MTTPKRASAEEQAIPSAPTKETHYFVFNLAEKPVPLIRLSIPGDMQMKEDPGDFLRQYRYEPIRGGDDGLHYYESTWADCQYLAVVELTNVRLVFHIKDDPSLRTWKQLYEGVSERQLLAMPGLLPDEPGDPFRNHELHRVSRIAAQNITNGYY